jgi:hypothetical protein
VRKNKTFPPSVVRELETFRKAHEAGNPFGLIDAVIFCDELADHVPGLALPRWAIRALATEYIAQLSSEKLRSRMGRHAGILEEHKQAAVDYFRYEAVLDAVKHRKEMRKETTGDKFELARRLCEGTPARASRATMIRSWNIVKRALKKRKSLAYKYYGSRYSRYFVPPFHRTLCASLQSLK